MKHQILLETPGRIKQWEDSLLIGNGKLGAGVDGGITHEVITLNEETIWHGGPLERDNPDAKENIDTIRQLLLAGKIKEAAFLTRASLYSQPKYIAPYVPAGTLCIDYLAQQKDVQNYQRRLDIDEAMAYVDYVADGIAYHKEYLVCEQYNVLAIKLSIGEKTGIQANLNRRPYEEHTAKIDDSTVALWGQSGPNGVHFFGAVTIDSANGSCGTLGDYVVAKDSDEVYLYLSFSTDFNGNTNYKEECLQNIAAAKACGYASLKAAHIAAYQALYCRTALSLGATPMDALPTSVLLQRAREGDENCTAILAEHLFCFGKYLLIAGSHNCQMPTNLQGIWNGNFTPSWECKYTININTQMNYWCAEAMNLPECHMPLLDFLERITERGKHTAAFVYGQEGSVVHHNTNLWADTAVEGLLDDSPCWPMGLAWLSTHLYEHYLYTKDRAFLTEKALPIIEQSIAFFDGYLYQAEDGSLLTGPSLSPENQYRAKNGETGALTMAPTMDFQILRFLFTAYIDCCAEIGLETPYVARAKYIVEHLPKTKIAPDGRICEWHEPHQETELGHRHVSHLFGLHPGKEILPETPDLFKAAEKTLDVRLENGSGYIGWSGAWFINMFARLRNSEKTDRYITRMIQHSIADNLLDTIPPFQIDGNFGFAAAVLETLVQSHNAYIELLPALPAQWRCGEAKGIKVRGNIAVDFAWADYKLTHLCLTAAQDTTVQVKYQDTQTTIALVGGVPQDLTLS